MRNKDTHSRITDKCRCLFVVAYSAMSITGLSSVLAVENHALSSPVSDRVESVQQKKHVSGNVPGVLTEHTAQCHQHQEK